MQKSFFFVVDSLNIWEDAGLTEAGGREGL